MTVLPDNILRLMNKKDRPKGAAGKTREELNEEAKNKNEKEIQLQIREYLRQKDIIFIQSRMDKRPTIKGGIPDFCFAWKGEPIALEVKREKGKCSEEQTKVQAQMISNGWNVFVVYSLEEVKKILNNL